MRRWDDWHVHLRDGEILKTVAPYHRKFGNILVMPNDPDVDGIKDAVSYREKIREAIGYGGEKDKVWMTVKITDRVKIGEVRNWRNEGILAGKLYPMGVTTASDDGVIETEDFYGLFEEMEKRGVILSVHAEMPGIEVLRREEAYLPILSRIMKRFPALKIVMEHISTKEGVEFVRNGGNNIRGTVTAHHLWHVLDDVIGDGIKVHNYCKPIPKGIRDRGALRSAVREDKFFFGSDSAPHVVEKKECRCGCAGVFSAPAIIETLMALGVSEEFVSRNGAEFYGVDLNREEMDLERMTWRVPQIVGEIVPWRSGEQLYWK